MTGDPNCSEEPRALANVTLVCYRKAQKNAKHSKDLGHTATLSRRRHTQRHFPPILAVDGNIPVGKRTTSYVQISAGERRSDAQSPNRVARGLKGERYSQDTTRHVVNWRARNATTHHVTMRHVAAQL